MAVVLVGLGAWIGVRGLLAKAELDEAKALISPAAAQVASFDLVGARATFDEIQRRTTEAAALTSDPIWRAAEYVPWVGHNLTATRELSSVTDEMVTALQPLVAYSESLDPEALVPTDGAIPLEPLVGLVPVMDSSTVSFSAAADRLDQIDASGTLPQIAAGADTLRDAADKLVPALDSANQLVPLIPRILGGDGPQTYTVMFQNNAEARSLGGTALFFALITMDGGRISLDSFLPAGDPGFQIDGIPLVPVPAGFEEMAPGVFGRYIPNATSRPGFPSAAQVVSANFTRWQGISTDGVISLDPNTVSYLLRATGAVTLQDGTVLDANNAVAMLVNTLPQQHNSGDVRADNLALDLVYGDAISQMFSRLSGGQFDVAQLFSAIVQASGEHRLLFWSAQPETQAVVTAVGLDNDIPDSDEGTDRIGVYLNDNVGSKLNFFLGTSLTTASAACGADGRMVHQVTAKLDNLLPADAAYGLSPQISGLWPPEHSTGKQKFIIYVYAPTNGTILSAAVNGSPVGVDQFNDDGHPVQRFLVEADPGGTVSVTVLVSTTGAEARALDTIMTPGVAPTVRETATLNCADVPAQG